ncbi:hypothetical protein ACN20G_35780 (plasmid) [Streptomyces sp. BI20]|uniref:hypothetical protein n=1 Tax=Streptomyces sp. BI20 TaxID=3403460 RepID=UPI003C75E731
MSPIRPEDHPWRRPAGEQPGPDRTERFTLTLTGLLPHAYAHAWRTVLAADPLGRTAVHRDPDGRPRRVPVPGARTELRMVDWRATRPAVQDTRLAELLAAEAAAGLRPEHARPGHVRPEYVRPEYAVPMRATLIRRDEDTWTLAWRYARELADRATGLRLLAEVADTYAVLLRGDLVPEGAGR